MMGDRLHDFRPQRVNANKHTERGIAALDNSIRKDGWIGAVTVAADGETFDGSARIEALADAMPSAEPIVIESDGMRPIIVKRIDIPNTDDPRAKRLGVAANIIAHMDYAPDGEILAMIAADDDAVMRLIRQDDVSVTAIVGVEAELPDPEPQQDPMLESECFIEIHCSRDDLQSMQGVLNEWATRPTITINIS